MYTWYLLCTYKNAGKLFDASALHPRQLPLLNFARFRRDQVAQRIRSVIAAHSFVVGIDFQHILGPIRIVLHRRQASAAAPATVRVTDRRRERLRLSDERPS